MSTARSSRCRPTASATKSCRTTPTTCASGCCRCQDVAKVEIFGAQDEKLFIEISQKRLAQLGLDLNQVLAQLGAAERGRVGRRAQRRHQNRAGARGRASSTRSRSCGSFPIRAVKRPRAGQQLRLATSPRSGAPTSTRRRSRCATRASEVIALGVSMAKGGDIIALGKALQAKADDDPRRPAGRHRAAPVPGPADGGVALGGRVRARADRGGGRSCWRSASSAWACTPSRSRIDIWPGPGGGHHDPAGAGDHLRHHVLLGRRPAQDLARLADHRARPAGRRRHHRGRDDGAQARGGLRQGARRHLRLRGRPRCRCSPAR